MTVTYSCDSYGGGIYNAGTVMVTNSTISGNTATAWATNYNSSSRSYGGGIYNAGMVTVTNSTISGNWVSSDSSPYGGGICNLGTMTLYNTIVVENSPNISNYISGYSGDYIIQGSNNLTTFTAWSGDSNNNLVYDSSKPLFIEGGYQLAPGSQAIDKGNNALAVDADGKPIWLDLDGNLRIANGTVDIGAYEYGSTSATPANFRSTNVKDTTVTLEWNVVTGATGYEIQYRKTSTTTWANVTVSETTAIISNLALGTEYEFQVRAVKDNVSVPRMPYSEVRHIGR